MSITFKRNTGRHLRRRLSSDAPSRRRRASRSAESRPGSASGSPQTVGEYLVEWLAGKRSLRPSTLLAYSTHVRLYLIPHLGDIALADLCPLHIQVMYRAIATENDKRATPLSAATLTRVHATLMSALGTAVRRGLLARNPAETVELPTSSRRQTAVWSAQQLARVPGRDRRRRPLSALDAAQPLRAAQGRGCGVAVERRRPRARHTARPATAGRGRW